MLDGHNRLEICERHNLEYTTAAIALASRDEARAWIIRNQFARRKLTPYVRAELALKLEGYYRAKGKEQQGNLLHNCVKPINTQKELSKIAGVSHNTMAKAMVIADKASPETKAALRTGETSIHQAYTKIRHIALASRDEARAWIIRNQFARRNLTPYVRAELALKLEGYYRAKGKEQQGNLLQNSAKGIDTRKELSKIAGVSHNTMAKAMVIADKAPEEARSCRSGRLRQGSLSKRPC